MHKLALVLLVAAAAGCTPAQGQTAKTVVAVTEDVCIPVVSALAPGDEPLCVLGAELADAAIDYAVEHGGQKPPVTVTGSGATVVPAELHAKLAAKPTVRARRAQRVCK